MQQAKKSGWIGRCISTICALFGAATSATAALNIVVEPPSPSDQVAPETVAPAFAPPKSVAPATRMLAARLAVQARLNVPVGKKARVAPVVSARISNRRPTEATVVKRSPQARSVFLPARHLATKAAPTPRTNVVALQLARPAAKRGLERPTRLAA